MEIENAAPDAMKKVRSVFEQKLADTREQVERLAKLERDLVDSIAYLDGCRACAPVHTLTDCNDCSINGHDGRGQPLLVAGLHNNPAQAAS